jgi:hypothetical protein
MAARKRINGRDKRGALFIKNGFLLRISQLYRMFRLV